MGRPQKATIVRNPHIEDLQEDKKKRDVLERGC
jgi:hypothetical protein